MIRRGGSRHAHHRHSRVRLVCSTSCASGRATASSTTAASMPRLRQAVRPPAVRRRRLRGSAHLRASAAGAARCTAAAALSRHPPSMFATVVQGLARSGCAQTRASSSRSRSGATSPRRRRWTARCTHVFPGVRHLPHRPLPRQGGGAEPAVLPLREHVSRADLESQLRRQRADHDGRKFRRARGAAAFTKRSAPSATSCRTTCCRCMALLAMDAPVGRDPDAMRAEKLRLFRAMRPLDPTQVVRGQFRGYRDEAGVAPDSQVETFAALRCTSTRGAGPAYRSTFARASACRSPPPKSSSI